VRRLAGAKAGAKASCGGSPEADAKAATNASGAGKAGGSAAVEEIPGGLKGSLVNALRSGSRAVGGFTFPSIDGHALRFML